MIVLVTENPDQLCVLDWLLLKMRKAYTVKQYTEEYGFKPPFLIVDGVPLDFDHSLKYLQEI